MENKDNMHYRGRHCFRTLAVLADLQTSLTGVVDEEWLTERY